jgi:hypothetical protein
MDWACSQHGWSKEYKALWGSVVESDLLQDREDDVNIFHLHRKIQTMKMESGMNWLRTLSSGRLFCIRVAETLRPVTSLHKLLSCFLSCACHLKRIKQAKVEWGYRASRSVLCPVGSFPVTSDNQHTHSLAVWGKWRAKQCLVSRWQWIAYIV